MRVHHIVELLIIVACLFILISEHKSRSNVPRSDKIIQNTFTYNKYMILNDEVTSKATKDIRYIEAK